MSELATISYVPTKASLNANAFLKNLEAYKMRHPILFYSDGPVGGCTIPMDNAEVLKGHRNKVAINNFIFLRGLEVAKENGVKRFIFLETDVRVGCDDWDGKIFDEAETKGDFFVAGTPCVWNATSMAPAPRNAVNAHISSYRSSTGLPVPAFHSRTREMQQRQGNSCLFIMGAGAVYDVASMERIFHKAFSNPMNFAIQIQAFDLHIGLWVNRIYGSDAPQKLPWLRSVWSGYQDKGFSPEERVELLKTGRVVLAHQFKTGDSLV